MEFSVCRCLLFVAYKNYDKYWNDDKYWEEMQCHLYCVRPQQRKRCNVKLKLKLIQTK